MLMIIWIRIDPLVIEWHYDVLLFVVDPVVIEWHYVVCYS